jgi:PAS domain S-box-containing protein
MGTIRLFSTCTASVARRTGWGFVCALAFALPALALNPNIRISQYAHTSWRSDAGIAAVRRIKQTPDGYLWLATRAGLFRFDGVRFAIFKAGVDTGLESSTIQDILIDPDGSMWVATLGGGLSHYQGGRFHAYTLKDGLPSLDINSLFRDSHGILWVGTRGAGIARMVNGKFETLTVPIPPSRITAFLEDLDHSLWIATDGFGVFRLQNGNVRSFSVTDGLPDNRILQLYRDHAGRIWTAGWKGISSWNGARFVANEAVNADVSEAISCFEDRDRNLWVGSTSGLLRVRGTEVARTDRSTGLSSDFVDDVFEDREGNLWVGSRTGLDRLRNDQIQSIGQPGPVVSDAQGVLTASNGQISRVAANALRPLPVSLPPGANVFTILSRPDAGFLIGTDKGAWIWTGKHIRIVPELSKLSIRSMLQDRDGSIWIGTANRGLLHWNPSAESRTLTETSVPDKSIITLAQDHAGAVWAGSFSGGGLYRLDGGKVQHFGRDEGLRSTVIYSVCVDKQGELWIGSADGLSWFQDGVIRTVNSQQGLPADQVFAILDDPFNRIWLGGQTGITAIDKKSLSEWASGVRHKLEPVLYPFPRGVETGFPTQFFPSAARSTDGNLWFGGIGGLCEVTPSDPAASHTSQFPVVVEDVTVDSVLHSADEVIGMPPGTRSIEFRYTALTLSNAEAVRFRYRLEGMDKDWVDADTRRLAFYDNLKPGTYKFRVAARVGEEQWQESPTLVLEQLPYFYQTWWFTLLASATGLSLLFFFYRLRANQVARHFNARLAERARIVEELRKIIDSIPGFVCALSPEGEVELVNQQLLDYFGKTFEEMKGWATSDAIHPDDRASSVAMFKNSIKTGTPHELEQRCRRADGVYRWFQRSARPVRDTGGRITAWYVLMTDIEDRKRAEEERRLAEEALNELRSELAHMARVTSLGALTASIAHEVNQPLSGIVTNAGTCLRTLSADPPNLDTAREAARRMIRDGNRASEVITRLRALFSKRDAKVETVDLNEAAREVLALCADEFQRNRMIVRQDLANDLPLVAGDRVQLQQVILNLLRNASDSMRSGAADHPNELLIGTERDEGDCVRLTVRDTGVGITTHDIERLFDAFYTTKSDGMGMGLSVSRSIIERHSGRLWATPNDGPGATFSFSIPCKLDNVSNSQTTD